MGVELLEGPPLVGSRTLIWGLKQHMGEHSDLVPPCSLDFSHPSPSRPFLRHLN